MWSIELSQGFESKKIKYDIVPYTRGRGLDLGCGHKKVWPNAIGVDNGHHFGQGGAEVLVETCEKLFFADESMDFVFSSHLLEHIEDYASALGEWFRVLKEGGYLVLYLPDEDEYPKVGEYGANPDHKWNVNYDRVVAAMEAVGSWDLVVFEKRNGGNEYSLLFVFRKLASQSPETAPGSA